MSETTLIHDPSTHVPDYAAEESARLEREFADIDRAVTDLLAEARALLKVPSAVSADTTHFTTDPRLLASHRDRVARMIERLQ